MKRSIDLRSEGFFPVVLLLFLASLMLACDRDSETHADEHVEHAGDEHVEHAGAGHAEHPHHTGHVEGVVELAPEVVERLRIRTAPVNSRRLPAQLDTTGKVDYEQDRLAHVTPRLEGRVERVLVDLGRTVSRGQTLAVIDSIELGQAGADYLQARAQEDLARQNYEREQDLYAERIASEKEMLEAKAAHLEALARLRHAEATLRLSGMSESQIGALAPGDPQASLLAVRAPLGGRVVEKHVTVGELVSPDRNMFTIADLEHVWIWIDVYERDLQQVHLEDDVEVEVDAFPGRIFGGKVTYLSDAVDPHTRTARARIDVANPKTELRPGMFARVRVTDPHLAPQDHPEAPSLVVTRSAVQRDGEESIVFVAAGPGRFERRVVTLGRQSGELIEILSGLAPADGVVVEGAFLLKSEASKEEMGAGHSH
jgi:cobalt-zinc-cadmium efflux system membrane fusion protein